MVSRVERTPFARWWWTVDRLMLAALFTLMLGGLVLSLAASPPVGISAPESEACVVTFTAYAAL